MRPIQLTKCALGLLTICLFVLAGCGGGSHNGSASQDPTGSSGLPSGVVARVGDKPITEKELDRWMRALSGSDFYAFLGVKQPTALATYPPSYEACESALKQFLLLFSGGKNPLGQEALRERCTLLDDAVRRQALSRLINLAVLTGLDAEVGVNVSPAEVEAQLERVKARKFQTPGALTRYLNVRSWTLAEEKSEIEEELLSTKLRAKVVAKYNPQELVQFANEGTKRWTARTTCRTGFAVPECSGYRETASPPSAARLLEGLNRFRKHTKRAPDLDCENTSSGTGLKCHTVGKLR